jgi:hypothetical protein
VDAASLETANVSWLIFKSKRMVGGPDGVKICRLLRAKGADINGGNVARPDFTPLAHAGRRRLLITRVHFMSMLTSRLFRTIVITVAKDNLEVAETLLRCGADPSLPVLGEANLMGLAQKLNNQRYLASFSLARSRLSSSAYSSHCVCVCVCVYAE